MKKTFLKLSRTLFLLGTFCMPVGIVAGADAALVPGLAVVSGSDVQTVKAYYFDATGGNDNNDGLTAASAWKTLKNVGSLQLRAGDQLLFKRGETFKGRLDVSAKGSEQLPVIIGAYGEGDKKPLISAPDNSQYAVHVFNSDYVTVEHLEVVNRGSKDVGGRTGVLVECTDYGVSKGIRLNDLFVHDVNGSMVKKQGGGSGILLKNGGSKKTSTYDGLTIEYCHIKNCHRNAMIWDACWDRTNWYPNLNVVVRYNLIEQVPGDGIVPIGCDGAIVEYNVMRDCTKMFDENSRTEAAAGIWPWSCDNTIIRFNEASGHKAPWDGQGFDADYNCSNTVIEYNYSHDNYGGMVLVCAAGDEAKYDYCWGNINPVVRYNISIGDGNRPHPARGKMFSQSIHIGGPVEGLSLYRNIVHNKTKAADNIDRRMLVSDDWVGCANNTTIKENIFYAPEESGFDFTKSKNNRLEGNYYIGRYKNYPAQQGGLPMAPEYEEFVKNSGADGLMQLMDSVTIAGGAKCVFVNKEKVEAFFNKVMPDPEFSAFVTPYYWAEGAVGALPVAETQTLLSKKNVDAAKSYLKEVADKVVTFDDTRYYRIRNYVRDLEAGNAKQQGNTGFMGNTSHTDWTKEVADVSCHGTSMADANFIWAFEKVGNTDTYKMKNLNNGKYLASTDANNASKYLKFTNEANAGKYSIAALQNVLAQHQLQCTTGNSSRNQLHASGAGVMNYNTGENDASSWYLIPATELEVSLAQMGEAQLGAYHFPFDVCCEDPSLKFYGVKALDKTEGEAMLVEMNGVAADNGAVLEGTKAHYTLSIKPGIAAPAFENLLSGVNVGKTMAGNKTYYVLNKDAQGVTGLYKAKSKAMKANAAFLELPAGTSVAGFHFTLNDITGIDNIIVPAVDANAVYHDLSGRHVLHPSNGVYIQNGKKVYIK